MSEKMEDQLRLLIEKVDRVLALLEQSPKKNAARPKKEKAAPLTEEEIARHQASFEKLFEAWDRGEELQVEKHLDAMDADELRRFADANNLNVTSKTPKQKVMQLVAGRFRERRQLMRSHFVRSTQTS
jgi:hypothetical protein